MIYYTYYHITHTSYRRRPLNTPHNVRYKPCSKILESKLESLCNIQFSTTWIKLRAIQALQSAQNSNNRARELPSRIPVKTHLVEQRIFRHSTSNKRDGFVPFTLTGRDTYRFLVSTLFDSYEERNVFTAYNPRKLARTDHARPLMNYKSWPMKTNSEVRDDESISSV